MMRAENRAPVGDECQQAVNTVKRVVGHTAPQERRVLLEQISHIALLSFCILAWLRLERKSAAFIIVAIAGAVHVAAAVTDLVKARRRRKAATRALRRLEAGGSTGAAEVGDDEGPFPGARGIPSSNG